MFTLPDKPESIGNTLDAGFRLYFKSFRYIVLFAGLMALVGLAPSLIVGPQMGLDETAFSVSEITRLYALVFGAAIINVIFIVCIIHRIHSFTGEQLSTIGETFRVGLRKFLPLLLMSILYGLAILAGLILLIIPGIFISIAFFYCNIALVTENRGPIDALGRSWELVKNNWWRTLVIISVAFLVFSMLYSIIFFAYGITVAMSSPDAFAEYAFYIEIGAQLINMVCYPMVFSISIAAFNDLRLRREGQDLEARIAVSA